MNYTEYLQTKGYTINSIRHKLFMLAYFKQWMKQQQLKEITEITYNDILLFIQHQKTKGNKVVSLNRYISGLSTFFSYLKEQKQIKTNPVPSKGIRGRITKVHHNLIEEKILEQIYQTYPTGSLVEKRNKIILGLMIYQGLSTKDFIKLEPSHLHLTEGKIYAPGNIYIEGRFLKLEAFQILSIQSYLITTRQEILKQSGKATEKLFTGTGNGTKIISSIGKLIKSLKKKHPKINLTNVAQIRASVISNWLKYYNIRQVQYMAGHKFVSSTEAYRTDNIELLQEELKKHHPLS